MKHCWVVGFAGSIVQISVKVSSGLDDVSRCIDLIFLDLLSRDQKADDDFAHCYDIEQVDGVYLIYKDGDQVFSFSEAVEVANYLMNAIKHDLSKHICNTLALHAALISNANGSVLLCGVSGSGKSSLTAGLVKLGFHYHTDELVLVSDDHKQLCPFVRPLSLKQGSLQAVLTLFELSPEHPDILIGTHASSIAHRLLNNDYIAEPPALQAILIPKFSTSLTPQVTRLKAAAAVIELMRCNVLARSMTNMGVEAISSLVEAVPSFQIEYSNFNQLQDLVNECNLYPF